MYGFRFLIATVLTLAFMFSVALFNDAKAGERKSGVHAFSFQSIDEAATIDLSVYQGKLVLLVNTASFCGFTPQYEGLETLWQRYRDRNLVVVGVPSNDFGGQEPKSEAEIADFCQGAFNVSFPLTKKYRVKGPEAHGIYKWVADETGGKASPRWNFHKLLFGADGQLAAWFPSSVRPAAPEVIKVIEDALESAIDKPGVGAS